jgi:hypothetical protein
MKHRALLFIILVCIVGCSKDIELNVLKKITYAEGKILTYESDTSVEKFEVQKIVNGRYEDSRSGACGKPPFDKYDYQAVHLRPIDTLGVNLHYVSQLSDDCGSYPRLIDDRMISSLNGSYQPGSYDMIHWLDEFHGKISDFNGQHDRITLRKRVFNNVYEFDVKDGKRLNKIYYSTRHGFVGYELKSGEVFELTNP